MLLPCNLRSMLQQWLIASTHTVTTMFSNSVLSTLLQKCVLTSVHTDATVTLGNGGCLIQSKNVADKTYRQGCVHKMFFTHTIAWRTPKKQSYIDQVSDIPLFSKCEHIHYHVLKLALCTSYVYTWNMNRNALFSFLDVFKMPYKVKTILLEMAIHLLR